MSNRSWTEILCLLKTLEPTRTGRGHPIGYPWYLMVWLSLWTAYHQWPIRELAQRLTQDGWPRVIRRSVARRLRRQIPDVSTLSRRWRAEEFFQVLDRLLLRLGIPDDTAILDGTVLPVGYHSKDPEARFGGPGSHFQRGYKVLRLTNRHGQAWAVRVVSADRNEVGVAPELVDWVVQQILQFKRVLGDSIFDSEALRQQVATGLGAILLAPAYRRGRGTAGGSRRPRTGAERRRAIRLFDSPWGRHWWNQRGAIERSHGWLKQRPHSLYALPAFIRRLHRVKRWVLCHEVLLSYRKRLRFADSVA